MLDVTTVRLPRAVLAAALGTTLLLAACGGSATPRPSTAASAGPSASAGRQAPSSSAGPDGSAAPTSAAPASAGPAGSSQIYVVKKGDNPTTIAKKFGVTVKALMAANPQVTDPTKLKIGQKLTIPAP